MRERVLGSRTVFEGRILRVRVDEVEAADGHRATREVIEHGGAVGIVIVHEEHVVLVRQYRHATGEELLEIPAGKLDPGEDPTACAMRECVEEVNLRAAGLEHWVTYYTTPGFTNELFHIFYGDDFTPQEGKTDPGEVLRVERVPLGDIDRRIRSGDVRDAKTLLGLSLLALRRQNRD